MKGDMRVWTVAAALALLVLGMQLRDALPSAQQVAAAPFIYGNQAPIIGEVDDVRATLTENLNGVPTNAVWLMRVARPQCALSCGRCWTSSRSARAGMITDSRAMSRSAAPCMAAV